jgi:hypothetical protein
MMRTEPLGLQIRPETPSCLKIWLKDKTFFAALAETY